jgi:hypothetical protein
MNAQVRANPRGSRATASDLEIGSIARSSRGRRNARRLRVLAEVAEGGRELGVAGSRRVLVAERGLGRRMTHPVHELSIDDSAESRFAVSDRLSRWLGGLDDAGLVWIGGGVMCWFAEVRICLEAPGRHV